LASASICLSIYTLTVISSLIFTKTGTEVKKQKRWEWDHWDQHWTTLLCFLQNCRKGASRHFPTKSEKS